jgi:hypothetical protein
LSTLINDQVADDALLAMLDPQARTWLAQTLGDAALLGSETRFRVAYAQATRKLARSVDAGATTREQTVDLAGTNAPEDDLVERVRRRLLGALLAHTPAAEHEARLSSLYRSGEQREQVGVLRALAHLERPERFVTLAIEACRTNSLVVFGAIAHDNPYPATHFPELHFNQLVLKSIFVGLSVVRIVGLRERAGVELARMVREYASERSAAGRSVPEDVQRVLTVCSSLDPR